LSVQGRGAEKVEFFGVLGWRLCFPEGRIRAHFGAFRRAPMLQLFVITYGKNREVVISIKSAGSWRVKSENLKNFLLLLL
jgi:hypothetical protein